MIKEILMLIDNSNLKEIEKIKSIEIENNHEKKLTIRAINTGAKKD